MSEASTTDDLSPRTTARHVSLPTASTAARKGVAEGVATAQTKAQVSPLEDILNKIMSSLEARRKSSSRPEELEVIMTDTCFPFACCHP